MTPISHGEVIKLIQSALFMRNVRLDKAAAKVGLNLDQLALAMAGRTHFSDRMLAGMGEALNIDYAHIAARYALYRYYAAQSKLRKPKLIVSAQPTIGLNAIAEQIVQTNPNLPSELLIQYIMSATNVMQPVAETALKIAQNTAIKGDYDNGRQLAS